MYYLQYCFLKIAKEKVCLGRFETENRSKSVEQMSLKRKHEFGLFSSILFARQQNNNHFLPTNQTQ